MSAISNVFSLENFNLNILESVLERSYREVRTLQKNRTDNEKGSIKTNIVHNLQSIWRNANLDIVEKERRTRELHIQIENKMRESLEKLPDHIRKFGKFTEQDNANIVSTITMVFNYIIDSCFYPENDIEMQRVANDNTTIVECG